MDTKIKIPAACYCDAVFTVTLRGSFYVTWGDGGEMSVDTKIFSVERSPLDCSTYEVLSKLSGNPLGCHEGWWYLLKRIKEVNHARTYCGSVICKYEGSSACWDHKASNKMKLEDSAVQGRINGCLPWRNLSGIGHLCGLGGSPAMPCPSVSRPDIEVFRWGISKRASSYYREKSAKACEEYHASLALTHQIAMQ